MENRLISFVIPCYRSERTIHGVVEEIMEIMAGKEIIEVILVNDYSPDDTYSVIGKLVQEYVNVKGVSLARNFGQGSAIMAGLSVAKGDVIVCLDDDGQSPVDALPKIIEKIDEGYDIVYADYHEKKESAFRLFGSKINELMMKTLLSKPHDIVVNSFFSCTRLVVNEVLKYKGAYPYLPGLMLRTTRNIANVKVQHREREYGKSNYTFRKLLALWLNGFTSFSVKPLRIATLVGFLFAVVGFIFLAFILFRKLIDSGVQIGWTSIISLMMLFDGLILIVLGLIGEYVGRIYLSINSTPQYIIRSVIEHDNEKIL